jgi:hypothetical protein
MKIQFSPQMVLVVLRISDMCPRFFVMSVVWSVWIQGFYGF